MGRIFHSLKDSGKGALFPFSKKSSAVKGGLFCGAPEAGGFISRRTFLKRAAVVGAAALLFPQRAMALNLKGVEYISIPQVAKRFGMKYRTEEKKKRQSVYSKNISLEFTVNRRDMTLAGRKIWMGFPVAESGGTLYIAESDCNKALVPILTPSRRTKITPLYHIVIDPGHGGKDNGAMNRAFNLNEKTIALDISNKLSTLLKSKGYKVTLTRTRDVFVELPARGALANKWGADMFVSIHCNAASPNASGVETYAMTPMGQPSTNASSPERKGYAGNANDDWNTLLAYYVQSELHKAARSQDRGVKRARFAVLVNVTMPAILVETGFISNPGEARKLATNDHRQAVAKAICGGILRYQQTIDRLRGRT